LSDATTASPPERRTPAGASGFSGVSANASVLSSFAGPIFGTTAARRSKLPVSSSLAFDSAAALSRPTSLALREELVPLRLGELLAGRLLRVGLDLVADLGERRERGLLSLERDEHVDRLVGLDQVAHLVLCEAECLVRERLHTADVRDVAAGGEGRGLFDLALAHCLLEGLAADDGPAVAVGLLAGEVEGALAGELLLDLLVHRVVGSRATLLVLVDLDDVEAERGLDDLADLARLERERGGFELDGPSGRAGGSRGRRPWRPSPVSFEYFLASSSKLRRPSPA
jgi:hypothetical protein